MRNILDAGKFLITLKPQQLLILLVVAIMSYLIYENQNLRKGHADKDVTIDRLRDRYDDYVVHSNKRVQECESTRIKEAAVIQEYYRNRLETLEARAERNYRRIR